MRSFWLARKPKRKRALRPRIERPEGSPPHVALEVFELQAESEVRAGTVTRARATCPCCESVLPPARVRAQLAERQGGADAVFDEAGRRVGGACLTAVVTLKPGETGRRYRLPTAADHAAVRRAQGRLVEILDAWERGGRRGLCPVPDEPVDEWSHTVNRLPNRWCKTRKHGNCSEPLRKSTQSCVPLECFGRENRGNLCSTSYPDCLGLWGVNPFSNATGSYDGALDWVTEFIKSWPNPDPNSGRIQSADATKYPLPDEAAGIWFTDPPYYDAIDYSHCSDFFFVWLKRTFLSHPLLHDPYDPNNVLTPESREIVVYSTTTMGHGTRTPEFYEHAMAKAFAEGRRVLRADGVGVASSPTRPPRAGRRCLPA